MSRSRYRIFEDDAGVPYFLTCTIVGWLPVFTRRESVDIIYDSWNFLQQNGRLTLYGYVILENHLHLIASSENLSEQIGDFKSYTAKQIVELLKKRNAKTLLRQLEHYKDRYKVDQNYQVRQEGSHPERIGSDEMMVRKLEYMHTNPLQRGDVDDPVHWRYSSARNYAGLPGLIEVKTNWRDEPLFVSRQEPSSLHISFFGAEGGPGNREVTHTLQSDPHRLGAGRAVLLASQVAA